MKMKTAIQILVMAAAVSLASCGGSSKDPNVDPPSVVQPVENITLKGTVAIGDPLKNTQVFIQDNSGNQTETITDDNGKFSIAVPQLKSPYLLKVIALGNRNLFSYAVNDGTIAANSSMVANINPLTDLVTRNLFRSDGYDVDTVFSTGAGLASSPSVVKTETVTAAFVKLLVFAYQSYSIPVDFDFFRADFDANNRFWALLANLRVTIVADNVSVAFVDPTSLTTYVFVQLNLTFDFTQLDQQAPTVPNNVKAIAAGSTSMTITWDAATDNVGVAGYELYRGSNKIATLPYAAYKDSGLQELTEYCYSVVAVDGSGNRSARSTPVCATTAPPNPPQRL